MPHRCPRSSIWLPAIAIILMSSSMAHRWAAAPDPIAILPWSVFAACLALLVPVGLAMLASGGRIDHQAALSALMGIVALVTASVGYLLTGFAFQFGGVGLITSSPGLNDLVWEWSFLDANWGLGWGMLGLRGFALGGEAFHPEAYLLFLSQIVPLSIAVLLPLLALRGRVRPAGLVVTTLLLSMVVYPIAGNWVWGGGWLANLGANVGLGHGFVDFAGAGVIHLLGASVALAGLLVFSPPPGEDVAPLPVRMPPIHLPILAVLGSFIVLPGVIGLALSNPLLAEADVAWSIVAVNFLMAGAGGALLALLYSWFTTGAANVFMTARGLVCGVVAISAVCPFVPAWLALMIGAFAGLMLPVMSYVFTYTLRLSDQALIVPIHGVSAVWGLVAVGLFANGWYGRGWNGVGAVEYLGVSSQGVTGLLTPVGVQPDFPQQLYAQLIGMAAIGLFAFVVSWVVFRLLAVFCTPVKQTGLDSPDLSPRLDTPDYATEVRVSEAEDKPLSG